ncbi:polysaccharide biosynthesis tyrosine autokinase [Variovorax sp. J2P1-59]|uniref:polysaccharide biosynthesis tyrosine autokinase n=1 Tax=Variovorax flavidus TaxID=3053501 RepID=UPI00257756F1|nr:polysaccharide biosynthesis tyrosine autokinase [Variovorax sp. J2P1-59]MDM0075415.1 polysaccharide biosynthesis tyrosine autokinase [Variovorax sp. J2P1-59]
MIDTEDEPRLSEYRDIMIDHKWLIVGTVVSALLAGLIYVTLATPVYRANLLLQIEDSVPDSKSKGSVTETSGLFEVKTPATGEIQVLASRMVLNAAAEQTDLQISAQPRHLPGIGRWLSRRATGLSDPGFLGLGGFVTGTERIEVARFDVPPSLEDTEPFTITAQGDGRYTVRHELLDAPLDGVVGQPLRKALPDGVLEIQLSELAGKPGAEFTVAVASRLRAIERLQERLQLSEQGRQSNVIGVTLEDSDRIRLARVLNAIGEQYVRQNMERKSAEAERTLAFLNTQLPIFQRQLQGAEDVFARFRNRNGTVDFDEEAKVWLKRTSDLQSSLLELQQRRRDADVAFTEQSPRIQLLNRQIGAVQAELNTLNTRIAGMPNLQRDALRLERDVRVNSTLYQAMQNNILQMQLIKEGKIGNVRLLDKAVVSKVPVKPQKTLVLAFALLLGALLGPALAILRTRFRPGIHNPDEIEAHTGLDVHAVVPLSAEQVLLDRRADRSTSGTLLADANPHSPSIEALRTLRVGLKLTMAEASNNRILITGATPGVGKSFIASNFATLLAQAGKRVLLIDADLRKGHLDNVFGLPREGGLSELITGEIGAQQAVHAQVRPHLDVMTTGKLPDMPADLLESQAFTQALDALSEPYDVVVIDATPVLVAADAAAVASACGVVLLVARSGKSKLGEVNESIRRLGQAGAAVSGVLFNGMDFSRRYNGSHGYRHGGYRHEEYKHA